MEEHEWQDIRRSSGRGSGSRSRGSTLPLYVEQVPWLSTIGQNDKEDEYSSPRAELQLLAQMDRKNKISVTTMAPRRRNSSTPTSEERDGDFAINARALAEFDALQMLARTSLAGMNPQEEAAALAVAEAEEAVAAAEEAVAAAEEAVWEADSAEAEAHRAVKTLCLMSIGYDWMFQASGAMVSHLEPKTD